MELKELRTSKHLTQAQAASLAGISLRSYKDYENIEQKRNSITYRYLINVLNEYGYIDETHGILTLEDITNAVSDVFKDYDVDYCYLFGSYARNEAKEDSDVDLLVSTSETGMELFGLAEKLRVRLRKKVDLLNLDQLNNNIELVKAILKDGRRVYGKR